MCKNLSILGCMYVLGDWVNDDWNLLLVESKPTASNGFKKINNEARSFDN